MQHLNIKLKPEKISYPIILGSDNLKLNLIYTIKKLCRENKALDKIVIVTDNTVKKLYRKILQDFLQSTHHTITLFSFPAGEKSKNIKTKEYIESLMFKKHCNRNTLLISFGGGVVGDLAGYVAATYMRGIPYIQIPTTLLSMVDSSIGGKTSINNIYGKNLIGAFYQPKAVIIDIQHLRSLPQKQFINGLIEIIKIFLTSDKKNFFALMKNIDKILARDPHILHHIIYHAIKHKALVVAHDEKEKHLRAILNFGHTIGHALELLSDYKILHGYAVAFGILLETKTAVLLGKLPESDYLTIQKLLSCLGVKIKDLLKFKIDHILKATKADKKNKHNQTNYVLLMQIGKVYSSQQQFAHHVSDDMIKKAYLALQKENNHDR